jgi:hypothetical protein
VCILVHPLNLGPAAADPRTAPLDPTLYEGETMKATIPQRALAVILTSLLGACAATGEAARDYASAGSGAPCAPYWKDEALARTHPRFEEALRCLSIGGGGP